MSLAAVAHTQSYRPHGIAGGGEGSEGSEGGEGGEGGWQWRWRWVTGAVAFGAEPFVVAGDEGAGIRSSIGGPSCIAAAEYTIDYENYGACTAY